MKNKKELIFLIVSGIVFFISIFIYGFRFIKYYKLEHPKYENIDNRLSIKVKENSIEELKNIENDYVFINDSKTNYVYFSNQLFRIIKVNEKNELVLITDDLVSSMVYGDVSNYKDSYINSWLNDVYYNSLNNKELIVDENLCIAKGKDRKANCKEKETFKVGLLSYFEYKEAGGNLSYLNINKNYWTLTPSSNNNTWYIFDEGGVDDNNYSTYYDSYGIRPVITLDSNIEYTKGTGTKDDPYIIGDDIALSIGKYINYSDQLFKIIRKDETGIYLALDNTLEKEMIFSNNTNIYNKNYYNSIYTYLNYTYYNSLDKNLLVEGTYYIGNYDDYDYKNIYKESITSKVGLLNVSDIYTTDIDNYVMITPFQDIEVALMKEKGITGYTEITKENKIRPVISIKNEIKVNSGSGTKSDPYVVGDIDE